MTPRTPRTPRALLAEGAAASSYGATADGKDEENGSTDSSSEEEEEEDEAEAAKMAEMRAARSSRRSNVLTVPIGSPRKCTPRATIKDRQIKKEDPNALPVALQYLIYGMAVVLLCGILLYPSPIFCQEGEGHHSHEHTGGKHMMMRNIAYGTLAAGALAYLMHMLNQPLLLGYLLGGVLVGPIGLQLIVDQHEIETMSELGLIFLLFMIGLELNMEELAHLGSKVFVSGLLQFPICVGLHLGIFAVVNHFGFEVGEGPLASLYVAVSCGLSSTMVVVKQLQDKQETTTAAGRISVGILIFQDMWAIIVLAVQPNIEHPEVLGILRTFVTMSGLVGVAFVYAKYVMPRLLASASKVTEMMLVLSLSWCFFVCTAAILPFVNLSMELAALIAGASLATFPYSSELNAKIRYIRDFFITLYFVALGMQIPLPTMHIIVSALGVTFMVLVVRWAGIFVPIYFLGGGGRPASITTVNLSQVSEFALVICAIGYEKGHIHKETLTILIWTFLLLAVMASYLINGNSAIYNFLYSCIEQEHWKDAHRRTSIRRSTRSEQPLTFDDKQETTEIDEEAGEEEIEEDEEEHADSNRDILALGLFTVGHALVKILEKENPKLIGRMHIIDLNTEQAQALKARGLGASYGDISSAEVLSHAMASAPKVVISMVPDTMLRGVNNLRLLELSAQLWPETQFIGTAENQSQANDLYKAGAAYVVMPVDLSAQRLATVLGGAKDVSDLRDSLRSLQGIDNPYIQRLKCEDRSAECSTMA